MRNYKIWKTILRSENDNLSECLGGSKFMSQTFVLNQTRYVRRKKKDKVSQTVKYSPRR